MYKGTPTEAWHKTALLNGNELKEPPCRSELPSVSYHLSSARAFHERHKRWG